uniref:NPH3 domain-containing protein n=1 Tax=Macrostomum lignano TaxID=282301 RepID=A0A1I8J8Q3_9PLAT
RCLAALLDIWHRAEASAAAAAALSSDSDEHFYRHHHHYRVFSSPYSSRQQQQQQRDTENHLLSLPLPRFLQLIQAVCPSESSSAAAAATTEDELKAETNAHLRRRPLAELAARYLDQAFSRHLNPPQQAPTPPEREADAEKDDHKDQEEDHDDRVDKQADEKSSEQLTRESGVEVLDRVILALPADTPLSESINADWIRRALRVSETASPECRAKLLQLAGGALHRFTQDELRDTPAPVLCEIVENTVKNDGVVPEVLSCVIDCHLLDLARAGGLPVADFVKLAASMSPDYRTSHDTLYEAAEALLSADPLPPESERQQVFDALDLNRCSEAILQRALDKGLVPARLVCQAAIDVAKRLRYQLEELEKIKLVS